MNAMGAKLKQERDPATILVDHEPVAHQHNRTTDGKVSPVNVTIATVVTVKGDKVQREIREDALTVRRETDARVFDRLDEMQQDAAGKVFQAFRIITGSVGARTFGFETRSTAGYGGSAEPERIAHLRQLYFRWAVECLENNTSHHVAVDFIGLGKSLRAIDADRRRRKGWAMEHLLKALDVWCCLEGWKPWPKA